VPASGPYSLVIVGCDKSFFGSSLRTNWTVLCHRPQLRAKMALNHGSAEYIDYHERKWYGRGS
jgi:hypothetical protein